MDSLDDLNDAAKAYLGMVMKEEVENHNENVKMRSRRAVPAGTVLINRNGTSKRSDRCDNCGAWIQHWNVLSGDPIPSVGDCPIVGCDGKSKDGVVQPIEGCHVMIKGEGQTVYIAPLCKSCNHRADGEEMVLGRETTLVLANMAASCGKLKDPS